MNVVEPTYYYHTCNKCGTQFNYYAHIWEEEDMVFCSEECMNAEKEYWYDVAQIQEMTNESGINGKDEDLPHDEFGNYDPKGNF